MCVIIGKKCQLPNSKKKSWFLYKIRDRNYDPDYQLEVKTQGTTQSLYLVDQGTKWKEGVNNKKIMIVSAALDNHTDVETTGSGSTKKSEIRTKNQHKTLEEAMSQTSVKAAQKVLIRNLFVGTTFISDGTNFEITEIYLNNARLEELLKIEQENQDMEELSFAEQMDIIHPKLTKDDYDVAHTAITEDELVIRTNHGKLLKNAGYQPSDEETAGWESSTKRWNYTSKAIKQLGDDVHPFSVLTVISNLTDVDKIKQNNPIRPQEELPKEEQTPEAKYRYYTSSIIMLSPTGVLFLLPMTSNVDMSSSLKLKPDREVDFVLLPKRLKLYESLTGFDKFRADGLL